METMDPLAFLDPMDHQAQKVKLGIMGPWDLRDLQDQLDLKVTMAPLANWTSRANWI